MLAADLAVCESRIPSWPRPEELLYSPKPLRFPNVALDMKPREMALT